MESKQKKGAEGLENGYFERPLDVYDNATGRTLNEPGSSGEESERFLQT